MQDSTGRDSKDVPHNGAAVDSEATSKETVHDLEDTEADSSPADDGVDPGPSPDGALDESDEIKDAGPM